MPNLKRCTLGVPSSPVAQGVQAVNGWETAGVDFFAHWDQRNLITPRSTWAPDVLRAVLHERRAISVPA